MKNVRRKIRRNVFETNSSSSHSLTLSKDRMRDYSLAEEALKQGSMTVRVTDHFGWEWKRLYKPENKVAYLLSQVASYELNNGGLRDNTEANDILSAVEEATGVDVHVLVDSDYAGIDHQSIGVGRELLQDRETLLDFIFSRTAFIQTGNDNSHPPAMIETDIGRKDEMFPEHYTQVMPEGLRVEIEAQINGKNISVRIADGDPITAKVRWSGAADLSEKMSQFIIDKANIVLQRPESFSSLSMIDGVLSDGSEFFERTDLRQEMAENELHEFINCLSSDNGDVKLSRDCSLAVSVADAPEGTGWREPKPVIRLSGIMSPENAARLEAGILAIKQDNETEDPSP